jgi:type IV secretory pathway VirB2 component (pilin)
MGEGVMLDRTDKAAKPPKTDHWSALENEHQGSTIMLLVSGLVEVGNTNKEPHLDEVAEGPGRTLILDLTIETADHEGTDIVVWKPANFSKRTEDNEYRDVHIRWDGKVIGRCKVIDDDQAHARLTLQTDAANLKAGFMAAPGRARKAASSARDKAKEVVEAIGKAMGGPVGRAVGTAAVAAVGTAAVAGAASLLMAPAPKKASKKAAKQAPKKAAKKAAKKAPKKAANKATSKKTAKAKSKATSKAKAKTTTKAKAKKSTKAKNNTAPNKSAKRATRKTRTAKTSRGAKKRSTKR